MNNIFGYRLQPIIPSKNMVLAVQFPFEFRLLIGVQFRFFDQVVNLII